MNEVEAAGDELLPIGEADAAEADDVPADADDLPVDILSPADAAGHLALVVEPADAGARVDRLLGRVLAPRWSRSFLSALVEQGSILVDGRPVKSSFRVAPGMRVEGELGTSADVLPQPEPMALDVLHADEQLIVVNKPVGLVIHPGTGAKSGTLVNGLLGRFPEIAAVGRADRPGIVHRLDRDTSGVMVVARTNDAARSLVNQFKAKTVRKQYTAVVWGVMPFDSDWIDLPLGPDSKTPALRAVVREGGQPASTFYKVERRLPAMTIVTAEPRTGRTHQIRVHLEHIGYPIVGDRSYGRRAQVQYARWCDKRREHGRPVPALSRQALHARRVTLEHPGTGERVTYEAPLPADMAELLELAADA
jgi:23S rRNA pseudouridine1911/1915/1917 synthase